MVTSLARIMEITTNLGISSHNLGTIEKCKKSEDNFIGNRSFTINLHNKAHIVLHIGIVKSRNV
jgi:hypothetical protein